MFKFKSYGEFLNEDFMSDIFKSAHGALDPEDLEPLSDYVGRPHFPTEKEFDEAVEFMNLDPDCLFFNRGDRLHPIIYWKGPVFYGFFGGHFGVESLKMMRADKSIEQQEKMFTEYLKKKDYESVFSRAEKKITIPLFIEMYDEIPDNQKYDVFSDVYVRSEYGFQAFPIKIIKDCFNKRKLSKDWKERMIELKGEMKLNDDGTVTVYRGENTGSAKSDDAFSWTLSKKTAKFFADRFNKGAGKTNSKNIDPSEIIDYLPHRGETEIILMPKKFGSLNEGMGNMEVLLLRGGRLSVRFIIKSDRVNVIKEGANFEKSEWFTLDKNSNFASSNSDTEDEIYTKLANMFENIIDRDIKEMKLLLADPIFTKWWEPLHHQNRGKRMSTKFGV